MSRKPHEIMGIPPEESGGAPEYTAPPDEFNRFAPIVEEEEKPSRLRKVMLYVAAAGLIALGFFVPKRGVLPSAEAQATVAPTLAPGETPGPTDTTLQSTPAAATPAIAAQPTETPTLIATETPKVTPIPTPGVEVLYYYRASQVYYTSLVVSVPEQVASVSLRLKAPDVEEPALEIELTPQEIEGRIYTLRVGDRDDGFDASEFFASHAEANLTMELAYTVKDNTGEKAYAETFEPAEELWIYWRYDSEDEIGGIAEMMFGELFPNCFVVRLYESQDPEQQLTVGDDIETLKNGGVTITVSIDGREIPAEGSTLYKAMYKYTDSDTIFYDYALVVPIPEDFPQHGTAIMTLTRKLIHSDTILSKTKTIEY